MHLKLGHLYSNHRFAALCYHIITGNLWKLSHAKVLISDISDKRTIPEDNITHCIAALEWIFRAQDNAKDGGVSAEYNFSWGWSLPYPEVSGYIIPTILSVTNKFPESVNVIECEARARKIADWLISIQHQDGSYSSQLFYNPEVHGKRPLAQRIAAKGKPCAFETGQIVWGLMSMYQHSGEICYLEAACKAGDWLVNQQSSDGAWSVEEQGVPVSFSALTARHLAYLASITANKEYENSAIRNCNWCLSKQNIKGWFNDCAHELLSSPWMHGIAYAVQGLLETGVLIKKDEYIEAAIKTADILLKIYSVRGFKSVYKQEKGFLPARFNGDWQSTDNFSCIVGNAQISLIWSLLYQITYDVRYLNAAIKMNQDLKSMQLLESSNPGIRGGIRGSHPIWGLYRTFGYPAWAAKFFIDTLLAEERALTKLKEKI